MEADVTANPTAAITPITIMNQDGASLTYIEEENEENEFEMYLLFGMALLGIMANVLTISVLVGQQRTRRITNAFLLHSCLLNIVQCAFCIPFAVGLHSRKMQIVCNSLGTSYIVLMTASCFNLVAIICCEVYTTNGTEKLNQQQQCAATNNNTAVIAIGNDTTERVTLAQQSPAVDVRGSACCVLFGISLVYIGSIILHLGPTIIGGNFVYDKNGFCVFIYGQKKNYVVFLMWILIVSLALTAAIYYLVIYYRTITKHAQTTVFNLIRETVAITPEVSATIDEQLHQQRLLLSHQRASFAGQINRAKVLTACAILHCMCWYPLFLLIIIDPNFKIPVPLYEGFTILGWSNAAMEPLIFLIFDRQINLRLVDRVIRGLRHIFLTSTDANLPRGSGIVATHTPSHGSGHTMNANSTADNGSQEMIDMRIGERLCSPSCPVSLHKDEAEEERESLSREVWSTSKASPSRTPTRPVVISGRKEISHLSHHPVQPEGATVTDSASRTLTDRGIQVGRGIGYFGGSSIGNSVASSSNKSNRWLQLSEEI